MTDQRERVIKRLTDLGMRLSVARKALLEVEPFFVDELDQCLDVLEERFFP